MHHIGTCMYYDTYDNACGSVQNKVMLNQAAIYYIGYANVDI